MARRVQVFTRLYPRTTEMLVAIGEELEAEYPSVRKTSTGEINTSEVIRILLGKADSRLKED